MDVVSIQPIEMLTEAKVDFSVALIGWELSLRLFLEIWHSEIAFSLSLAFVRMDMFSRCIVLLPRYVICPRPWLTVPHSMVPSNAFKKFFALSPFPAASRSSTTFKTEKTSSPSFFEKCLRYVLWLLGSKVERDCIWLWFPFGVCEAIGCDEQQPNVRCSHATFRGRLTYTSLLAAPVCSQAAFPSALYSGHPWSNAADCRTRSSVGEDVVQSLVKVRLKSSSLPWSAIRAFNFKDLSSFCFTLYYVWLLITFARLARSR